MQHTQFVYVKLTISYVDNYFSFASYFFLISDCLHTHTSVMCAYMFWRNICIKPLYGNILCETNVHISVPWVKDKGMGTVYVKQACIFQTHELPLHNSLPWVTLGKACIIHSWNVFPLYADIYSTISTCSWGWVVCQKQARRQQTEWAGAFFD